ncbi:MAG: hypothetical protein H7Z76_11835 [Methylotenera sp.]|nr:hypothetical protein [Flavobacterium sp.]
MKFYNDKSYENLNLEKLRINIQNSIASKFTSFSSTAVFDNSLLDQVYLEHYLSHLSYSKGKSKREFYKRALSLDDIQDNTRFVPNMQYYFWEYCFAVNGNPNLLFVLGNSTTFKTNKLSYNSNNPQKYFIFKMYSEFPFVENEVLIGQFVNDVKEKIQLIEESIREFNSQIDEINFSLKHFSETEFLKEKAKRDFRDDNLDKLSSF